VAFHGAVAPPERALGKRGGVGVTVCIGAICENIIKPSSIHCAFLSLLFAWPSSSLNAAIINLSCEGTRSEKHYAEKREITYLAQIDLDRNEILLKTPRITFQFDDTKGESANLKLDVEQTHLKIYAIQDGFLFLEKEGKVNDSDFVIGRRENSLHEWPVIGRFFNDRTPYEVKVRSDDYARGFFDPYLGRLTLETRFYTTAGPDYEYGWSLDARCKNAQQPF
jgi:hypothetical protein